MEVCQQHTHTLLLSFYLQWNKLASQTLLTKGDRRKCGKKKKNPHNSSLYLSSAWIKRKVKIPN